MDPAVLDHARASPDTREHPLKASPTDQLRLLDLQGMDTRLDQIAHRRRTLPEDAEVARIDARLGELRDRIVGAETERSDTERERAKADADVEQVRQRARRDQQRLDAGTVSTAKELTNLQHEIASLARRQSVLEDVELEIMERLEVLDTTLGELRTEREAVEAERSGAAARRDTVVATLEEEASVTAALRTTLAGQIDGALVALYEKLRVSQGGLAAAPLRHRRCQGCMLELTHVDMSRITAAAEDEVLRCDECDRILVRTPESGL